MGSKTRFVIPPRLAYTKNGIYGPVPVDAFKRRAWAKEVEKMEPTGEASASLETMIISWVFSSPQFVAFHNKVVFLAARMSCQVVFDVALVEAFDDDADRVSTITFVKQCIRLQGRGIG